MRKWLSIPLALLCSAGMFFGQNPSCPDQLIYLDGAPNIRAYDPSKPVSSTNPMTLNIPVFGSGLALLPNINGSGNSTTFYTTSGGTYHYWNGTSWVNTGHTAGNSAAINLSGCPGKVYNLVGSTGAVYVYNGSSNGVLLTTVPNFNGSGPYDLATDCDCNFYVLNTSAPGQYLTMYNQNGQAQCTYTLQGMPNSQSGTGLAILGNNVFVRNSGFYIGTISGSVINFTSVPTFTAPVGDFATCASCYSSTPLTGASISGNTLLTCAAPTTSFYVTSTLNPVTYNWVGPGILGSTTGSVITLNAAGVYSCTVMNTACNPSQITLTLAAQSNVVSVAANITPGGNICSTNNSPVQLSVAPGNSSYTVSWKGPGLNNVSGTNSVSVNNTGTYTVEVTDPATGCVSHDFVNVGPRPKVTMALSSPSFCANNYNGSHDNLTVTANGATSYTFFTSTNAMPVASSAQVFNVFSNVASGNTSPLATGTLIGKSGFCTDTATTSFSVVPNPAVSLSSSVITVCPGGSATVAVQGAGSYTWTGPTGLSSYSSPTVVVSPSATSIYSVCGNSNGCNSMFGTFSFNVQPNPTLSISAAASSVCAGSTVSLSRIGTATSFSWYPANQVSAPNAPHVIATLSGPTIFTLVGAINGCTAVAHTTVQTVAPPVVSMAVSHPTMCFSNYNGSPNTVTVTANGANSYTLLTGPNGTVSYQNGSFMHITSSGAAQPGPSVMNATLLAVSGVCTVIKTQSVMVIPNPTLTITPPLVNVCPDETKAFTVHGANNYYWSSASAYTLTAPNSIQAAPKATSYYSVYGTSSGCNSSTKSSVALVQPLPEIQANPPASTVCAGSPVALSVKGNASHYQWYPNTGLNTSTGASVIATPMSTQQYTIIASLNTCTNMVVTTVSAIPMPSISMSASSQTVCRGAPVSLYANGATSYEWFPSSILNTTEGAAVIGHPLENTTFIVKGSNGNCTGSVSVHVFAVKPPNMTISAPRSEICFGTQVPLSATGAQSYTWVPVSSLKFNAADSVVWASPAANTNYTVFGANTLGPVSCYQQLSYLISVVPNSIAQLSGNTKICAGEKTTLRASGGNTFSWSPSTGLNITNGSGVVANPSVSTVYTVHVSHNTYCGGTGTIGVTVNERPTVSAGKDLQFNRTEAMVLKATGTGKIRWIMGEGIACPECAETNISPQFSSCYLVEAVNEFGCRAEDQICVTLTEDFSVYVPNSFSPNGDGLNDLFLVVGEHISNVSLQVYNRWGARLFSAERADEGWDGTFNGQQCKPDVYTYVLSYKGLDRKLYSRSGSITLMR